MRRLLVSKTPPAPARHVNQLRSPWRPECLCLSFVVGGRPGVKAGEGNRTLVFSLEGYGSTIELHPRTVGALDAYCRPAAPGVACWQVGSLIPCVTAAAVRARPNKTGVKLGVGGTGFEPVKAVPSDLQSDPFDRSGNPPGRFTMHDW